MQTLEVNGHDKIKAWVDGVEFEPAALEQATNLAAMPFIFKHVAIMADVHAGIGATVGSVIATQKAIIPAAVGVDIGCGMIAQKTNLRAEDMPDSLTALRQTIEAAVPHGRTNNGQANDRGAWGDAPEYVEDAFCSTLSSGLTDIRIKHPKLAHARAVVQLGTLGTGNHFIEICLDETGAVWVMLHSGSRGQGNLIGTYFIELAKKKMEKWHVPLADKDLAFLPAEDSLFHDYCEAVDWAQEYALINRKLMLAAVLNALGKHVDKPLETLESAVNCHHNYVSREYHFGKNVIVTRKGAVSAREGQLGIIPGSMGVKSYIVSGKGNRESFMSCSHGAGRRMSRAKAKMLFTIEDHEEATRGVECRKDAEVIDETPGAYKDIDAVMEAQKDLVDIVHTLKQVLCVKG